MADNHAHPYNRHQVVTIDDLPDEVLLEIFDIHVFKFQGLDLFRDFDYDTKRGIETWQSLVHVCRRWRGLVFGSPRRLNLNICYSRRSARKSLNVWPTLPLVILGGCVMGSEESVDNIIAVLEHSDRICRIDLMCYAETHMKNICTAMQVPFPELAVMDLSFGRMSYVLPDSFLGGSTPRLQFLRLKSIPFPGLPKLLLCATHLVKLYLLNIPLSGYISPEAMATCLSTLTSLKSLHLGFDSRLSYPDLSRRPFSPIRSVLPALVMFRFDGMIKYFEEFVAWIDTPRLSWLSTNFFNDTDFNTQELNRFISRTTTLGAYDEAHLIFRVKGALVMLHQSHPDPSDPRMVGIKISDLELSTLAQICTLSSRLLFNNGEPLHRRHRRGTTFTTPS